MTRSNSHRSCKNQLRVHADEKRVLLRSRAAQALYSFFVEQCRQNLHLVIAMSPVSDAFRERLRKFPSLVNCTTIDW